MCLPLDHHESQHQPLALSLGPPNVRACATACAGGRYRVYGVTCREIRCPHARKGRTLSEMSYKGIALIECIDAIMDDEALRFKCLRFVRALNLTKSTFDGKCRLEGTVL